MRAGDSRGEELRDDRLLVVRLMELDIGDTVFVSVDIQPRARMPWTEQNLLDDYREEQFTLGELNQAVDHFFDVMLPAAEAVSKFARQRGIPRVFVHWSRKAIGDFSIVGDEPRPHDGFDVQPDDCVIAKTEMDAFPSSNIADILSGLGRRTLLMVGGHTRGCLGQTAKSAITHGYRCVLVREASFDCSYLRWPKGIDEVAYDHVVSLAELLRY